MWTRRTFIANVGAAFVTGLGVRGADALANSELIFVSACRMPNGSFAVAIVSERGEVISTLPLPARGHDIVESPTTGHFVSFPRRNGIFAVVFDRKGNGITPITSPKGRHFFGHGVFSQDGKLLYATENDYDGVRGMIGIYDASNSFLRIGEFYSGGIGPHDMLLSTDGRYLCVANGGFETHPDFGRTKLNIPTMKSNLCWIDRDNGTIVASHELPASLQKLSLRHMAMGPDNKVWVGGQYQEDSEQVVPLLAHFGIDDPLEFYPLADELTARFSRYVGSVAFSPDKQSLIATSPVGGAAIVLEPGTGQTKIIEMPKVCGADWGRDGFTYTSGAGAFSGSGTLVNDAGIVFDNHLLASRR